MRLDGLASVPARVRQKDGFPELTRRHKGLRAGAGLKCTFCSVAPQTPTTTVWANLLDALDASEPDSKGMMNLCH
jgi:hypothetical protein